jgi:hypothetical protein
MDRQLRNLFGIMVTIIFLLPGAVTPRPVVAASDQPSWLLMQPQRVAFRTLNLRVDESLWQMLQGSGKADIVVEMTELADLS